MYYIISAERTLYLALTDPDKFIYTRMVDVVGEMKEGMFVHTITLEETQEAFVEKVVSLRGA